VRATSILVLLVVVALSASTSSAQVALRFEAPDGCIDRERVARGVEAALGRSVFDDRSPGAITLEGTIRRERGLWVSRLALSIPGASPRLRELESDSADCSRLDDGVIVVAALMVEDARPQIEEVAAAAPPTAVMVPPPRDQRGWALTARVAALARVDALPGLSGAAALEVELTPPGAFALLLSLAAWPPVDALRDGAGARFVGLSGAIGGCPSGTIGAEIELGGCASASAMGIWTEGIGIARPRASEGLEVDLAAEAFARFRLGAPLWVRIALGAAVPVVRPRATFELEGGAVVLIHEAGSVVPTGSIGLELRALE
jgi:hypothetical protein